MGASGKHVHCAKRPDMTSGVKYCSKQGENMASKTTFQGGGDETFFGN